jgi:hypothetical protein
VSPDGRWISYVSDESGRPEVSVRNISGSPTRIVVSGDGGEQPVWRRDGAELFFVDPRGRLRSVSVRGTLDGLPAFGLPVELAVPPIGFGHWGHQYDVSPDGRRIYFMRRNEDQAPQDHRGHRLAFAAQMSTALSTATLPSPFICRASSQLTLDSIGKPESREHVSGATGYRFSPFSAFACHGVPRDPSRRFSIARR